MTSDRRRDSLPRRQTGERRFRGGPAHSGALGRLPVSLRDQSFKNPQRGAAVSSCQRVCVCVRKRQSFLHGEVMFGQELPFICKPKPIISSVRVNVGTSVRRPRRCVVTGQGGNMQIYSDQIKLGLRPQSDGRGYRETGSFNQESFSFQNWKLAPYRVLTEARVKTRSSRRDKPPSS